MRQQWRQSNDTQQEPVYDSQTVRQVLARASEIEQAEPDALSASQVEALGRELGISPEAVRRALGEIETRPVPTSIVATPIELNVRLNTLSFQEMATAPIPGLITGLIYLIICYGLSGLHSNPGPLVIGATIPVLFGIPVMLSFYFGWRHNKYPVALLSSSFITLFSVIGGFAGILFESKGGIPPDFWTIPFTVFFIAFSLNTSATAGGVWLRRKYNRDKTARRQQEQR